MNWGVNKTMGHIHGLMLATAKPMNADEVMDRLKLSRGNVNMNIRALIDWGLVNKVLRTGERKEFFEAEKDFWKVFKKIIKRRKERELDPMIQLLDKISSLQPNCQESDEFCRVIKELSSFSRKADNALSSITSSDHNWMAKGMMKMMR